MNDTQSGRSAISAADVIGRADSRVRRPGKPSGIDANLVRRVDVHAHEIELWVIDDGRERSPTDLASRPLHDPIRAHFPPLARLDVDLSVSKLAPARHETL